MPALLVFPVFLLLTLLLYFLYDAQHRLPVLPVYPLQFRFGAIFSFLLPLPYKHLLD